jgi:hypothetical protein
MSGITDLLVRARGGNASALSTLIPLVYYRSRERAHRQNAAESEQRTLDFAAACTWEAAT